MQTSEIKALINNFAQENYACDWDNTGFNVDLKNEITGVLICLDVTEDTINEAIQNKCNLIISHHPLLFNKINKIDVSDYVGKCVYLLAKNNISLYCAHTSMDSAPMGINFYLANALGIENQKIIHPTYLNEYYKLVVFVPKENKDEVLLALKNAGAGTMGNYEGCSFSFEGQGRFTPKDHAHPAIGKINVLQKVEEVGISCLCAKDDAKKILKAVKEAHPYETPAINFLPVEELQDVKAGLGIIGDIKKQSCKDVLETLKAKLDIDKVRFCGDLNKEIKRIALCGGGGSDLIDTVSAMGAQMFITGEIKHNFYMSSQIALVEAGHYDTEKCFLRIMSDGLQKQLNDVQYNIDVYVSKIERRAYINY